jgi:hypothetical protein
MKASNSSGIKVAQKMRELYKVDAPDTPKDYDTTIHRGKGNVKLSCMVPSFPK